MKLIQITPRTDTNVYRCGVLPADAIRFPISVKKIAFSVDNGYTVYVWKELWKGSKSMKKENGNNKLAIRMLAAMVSGILVGLGFMAIRENVGANSAL